MSSTLTWLHWAACDPWSVIEVRHLDRNGMPITAHTGRCNRCPTESGQVIALPDVSRALFKSDAEMAEAGHLLDQIRFSLRSEGVAV